MIGAAGWNFPSVSPRCSRLQHDRLADREILYRWRGHVPTSAPLGVTLCLFDPRPFRFWMDLKAAWAVGLSLGNPHRDPPPPPSDDSMPAASRCGRYIGSERQGCPEVAEAVVAAARDGHGRDARNATPHCQAEAAGRLAGCRRAHGDPSLSGASYRRTRQKHVEPGEPGPTAPHDIRVAVSS